MDLGELLVRIRGRRKEGEAFSKVMEIGKDLEGVISHNPKAQHFVSRKDQQCLMLSGGQTRGLRCVQ